MRATSDILEQMYDLPLELRARLALGRRVSLISLIAETGYLEVRGAVDIETLRV